MSRRKKRRPAQKQINYSDENSPLKKVQSMLTDPHLYNTIMHGSHNIRRRLLSVDHAVLRRTVEKLPLINAVINVRIDQIMPFCHWSREEGERGFKLVLNDKYHDAEKEDEQEIRELVRFFEETGFVYDPLREDDFTDYVQMLVRELLTIDQIATEIQPNRKGEATAFWLLDGATIYRIDDDKKFAQGIRFVQEIDHKVYAEYGDNLIFDYRYKRADVRFRGYGYSPVEQAINVITTLLFGYSYVQDQMVRDRVPKGFLSVMGDIDESQLTALQNYWYAAMSGVGGKWNIPILPSGKDGVGIEFKTLNQSNKDMEYNNLMQFISSITLAVFGMDLAELGLQSNQSQSIIHNESTEPRIIQSRNRGLEALLGFLENHLNKILRKVTDKYVFRFCGVEAEDEDKRESIKGKQLQSRLTVNDLREQDGLEPLKESYADVVLNPQAVQIYLADKQAEQAEKQQAAMGGEADFDGSGGSDAEEEDDESQTFEHGQDEEGKNVQKSFSGQEKVIRHVIE